MATTILNTNQGIATVSGISNAYKFYYSATLDSQSTASNTSTITFKFGIGTGTAGSYYYSGWEGSSPGVTLYWSSDNSTWTSLGMTVIGTTSASSVTYASKTFTVTHNSNGSKSIYLRAVYTHGSSGATYMPVDTTYTSSAITLTTIPRASSIAFASSTYTIANTGSTALKYTITPKASFYHKVVWTIGSSSTTVNKTTAISSAASYSDITNALMLAKFSGKTATVTATLYTYSDSSLSTQVGSATSASCSLTVDTSAVKPSISLGSIAKNTGNLSVLVAGNSTAKCTSTVTNSTGASTSSVTWSISVASGSPSSTPTIASSSASQAITNTLPSCSSNYTIKFSATVTDSRGATATATTSSAATVYGYSVPSFTLSAYRCVSTSDNTADGAGAAAYYSRSAVTYSSITGNSITCTFKRDSTSISTASTAVSGSVSLATTSSMTFTATAYDTVLGSSKAVTKTVTIPMASYPLDLYQSGSTVGVGLGQIAEANKVVTPLQIKTTKTGSGTNAGFYVETGTENAEAAFSLKRTDTGNGIELLVGTGGVNRGLYNRSDSSGGWLLYYDDTKLVAVKPLSGSSLVLSSTLSVSGEATFNSTSVFKGIPTIKSSNTPQIDFTNPNSSARIGTIFINSGTTNSVYRADRFYIRQFSYDSSSGATLSYYDQYRLPAATADKSENNSYEILTSKAAVTVAQGGTGKTAAQGNAKRPVYLSSSGITACNTLTSLYSGSLAINSSATLTNGSSSYNYLIVMGLPGGTSVNVKTSAYIPTALITTTAATYGIANENYGIAFTLTKSGNNIVIKPTAGTGVITNVYGGI